MVKILPAYDPGGDIGRSFGSGFGQALEVEADRTRMRRALDQLGDIDKPVEYEGPEGETLTRAPNFGEKLRSLVKAGVGIPGWMGVVETMAPAMMKSESGLAAKKTIDPGQVEAIGYAQEDDGVTPDTREDKVERLRSQVEGFVQARSQIPEDLTSEVPRFGRTAPAYEVPSTQDMLRAIDNYRLAGQSEDKAFDLLQKKMRLDAQGFESQMAGWQKDLAQFKETRGLEEEQRGFVETQASDFLRQQGFADPQGGVPKYYTDIAYRMFNKERRDNPGKFDQENWSQARQKLGQMLEHEAAGSLKGRPMLPILPGAKNAVKQTKAWTDDYLKMVGNTPETRDKARSILMNQGWSRHMALEYTQPFSSELQKTFNKLPKLFREIPGPQGQVPMGTVKNNRKKMEQIQAMMPEIAKSFSNQDSLYLLRNNLVREKGLNKVQADEVIESMRKERGGILPHQSKELPHLRESPRKDIWRIFYDTMF